MSSEQGGLQMRVMTIDDVIARLGEIIAWARTQPSRLGYFAALYRKVTIEVKEGIAAGRFQDGPRMEKFDVVFAQRYLDAFDALQRGQPVTDSWRVAFAAASRWRPIILQHLLLGMNAHINLDLGIVAAQVAPGPTLEGLRHDFNEINTILFSLVSEVEHEISAVSPWIGWLSTIGGKADDVLVEFSIKAARAFAWEVARTLAPLTPEQQAAKIRELDARVALLGRGIARPPLLLRTGLVLIRSRESNDIAQVIEVLE